MSAVRFHGVTKRFGSVVALDSLDLEIASGEFVSLLGPSGSGKSTTLNLLAGLLEADEGRIEIGERDVTDLGPDKRDLALVFQSYALYPHMTVFENLAFPLRAARGKARVSRSEIETRVSAVATTLAIEPLLDRYPRELSGGQQQRVALGRAMVRDPRVFLLDEPLSNLDARLRIRMRRDLKELHQRIQSTIVYVTHDQAEAMSMSSRIAVFNQGRLQQFAPPEDIYNRPANLFVANFVGERELVVIDAQAEPEAGGVALRGPDFTIRLPHARIAAPRPVTVGLRAEAMRLAAPGETGSFVATVEQTELSGPDRILLARTASGAELYCRTDPATRLAPGDRLNLSVAPERALTFDPRSGLALDLCESGAA